MTTSNNRITVMGVNITYPSDLVLVYSGNSVVLSHLDKRPPPLRAHHVVKEVQAEEEAREEQTTTGKPASKSQYVESDEVYNRRGQRVKQLPPDADKRIIRYMRKHEGKAYRRGLTFHLLGKNNPRIRVLAWRLQGILDEMEEQGVLVKLTEGLQVLYGLTEMMGGPHPSKEKDEHEEDKTNRAQTANEVFTN